MNLKEKIEARRARVGVIGLGYVGLPLAVEFARAGFDVTGFDVLNKDPSFAQWVRAKSFDTFGPFGPAVATGLDWSTLRIRTVLNAAERQNYPASDMILPPARIVSLISREVTLLPGDVIACGTSVGVGSMKPGSVVEVSIEGIGTLKNTVA